MPASGFRRAGEGNSEAVSVGAKITDMGQRGGGAGGTGGAAQLVGVHVRVSVDLKDGALAAARGAGTGEKVLRALEVEIGEVEQDTVAGTDGDMPLAVGVGLEEKTSQHEKAIQSRVLSIGPSLYSKSQFFFGNTVSTHGKHARPITAPLFYVQSSSLILGKENLGIC